MSNVYKITGRSQGLQQAGGDDGDGGGSLVDFRLQELERRVGNVEALVKGVNDLCIEMKTKLDDVPSKSYVTWLFAGTATLAILSILAHVALRAM